ncbi:type 1 glutamine amidotransferase domain-containing protein [Luteimonas viscosa]|uniref:Type 1 glutamine amidotransferase domain-containing protein n=1 Tax=Luteimonas viscosa TaxID=1132694 RepID=A0A5D4XSF3_9GAMM|nr:type 1 glutamine amidotransferase domain-containing protein [Luteimonas viscosa]TYT27004.1 type 1 glutamine amidotransferase domain-containing protein [Luteimonas viscosa]
MRRWIKRLLLGALTAVVMLAAGAGLYVYSLDLGSQPPADPRSTVADLAFMRNAPPPARGRILAVVSSAGYFPGTDKRAGFELTELSRAYYTFIANGYAVDIASPQGGSPPMRVDDEDMGAADHAFLNDAPARAKLAASLPLETVDGSRYAAVYFVGGKGAMFDFPGDADIARIVRQVHGSGGVIGAVCHGPAALLDVTLDDGTPLLRGRRVTGFTNAEELFLMEDARQRFDALLQDALVQRGARFVEGGLYLDNTVVDGRLVTGQNPWSTWSVAEAMVTALGHPPVAREATREEQAVRVMEAYRRGGIDAALDARQSAPGAGKHLLLMHALVAAMQGRWGDAWHLQRLAHG